MNRSTKSLSWQDRGRFGNRIDRVMNPLNWVEKCSENEKKMINELYFLLGKLFLRYKPRLGLTSGAHWRINDKIFWSIT